VIGGIAMNATQMLVIAIIMPTIVRDIGGASFYTWAAMLYTIGSIVGGASTAMVWSHLGARRAYTLGAGVFSVGTLCCALAHAGGWRDRAGAAVVPTLRWDQRFESSFLQRRVRKLSVPSASPV
jgi:MFS family permease